MYFIYSGSTIIKYLQLIQYNYINTINKANKMNNFNNNIENSILGIWIIIYSEIYMFPKTKL